MSDALLKKLIQRKEDGTLASGDGGPEGKQPQRRTVDLGWCTETVVVHPEGGPQVLFEDGSYGFQTGRGLGWQRPVGGIGAGRKGWRNMSVTEQQVAIEVAAKKNAAMKERHGADFFDKAQLPSKRQVEVAQRAMGGRPL
mmetsp:Transcript_20785/g.43121  ORF Transcript_20785/g.43121 Transcript_20785/m.43121 type:complete len:140 (+) Transcript_20785:27-446(+)